MIVAVLSANALISSGMSTSLPDAVSTETDARVEYVAQSNAMKAMVGEVEEEAEESARIIQVGGGDFWSAEKNARFKELAREEAVRDLTVEEYKELEELSRLRRYEKHPRTADEILWQRRQQKLTRDLVEALKAYVEFHEPPGCS